ncbi:hypothetical protein D9M69_699760 [compost metagenome]
MRILVLHARHSTIVPYLGLERLDKSINYLIRVMAFRQINACREPQINPKCEHTRILLNSPLRSAAESLQILLNKRPFIDLNRHSTIAACIMNDQILVLRMTLHFQILQC